MEGVAEPKQVFLEEYWQVCKNWVKDVIDIFLQLFVWQSKVLSKNKLTKCWGVINKKALPVTKAHFDSKIEATIQRSLQIEAQLAELQAKDTPEDAFEDADNDTSNDENEI
jgi:hypothetical protein